MDGLPEMQDRSAILAATLVRIRVASSRGGRVMAGDPFGHSEFLDNNNNNNQQSLTDPFSILQEDHH